MSFFVYVGYTLMCAGYLIVMVALAVVGIVLQKRRDEEEEK